jgi:TolA-binding protein
LEAGEEAFADVEYMALDGKAKERYDMRVGYIRFKSGDYERAKVNFSKVSKVSDYYHHTLYYTSYIHYAEGELDRAEAGFRQLESNETYSRLVPFYLLQIEYRRGNYELVISQGEKLLNQKTSEKVRDDLERVVAESYFILGDYAQAVRYMTNYDPQKMGRQENYILGYSLYRMTRYDEAIVPLKAVCGADDALTQNAA